MRHPLRVLVGLLALAALAGCGGSPARPAPTPAPSEPAALTQLIMAGGGGGGVFLPYAGGVAKVLSEKLPHTAATALETGGSVDNLQLLRLGEVQLGLATADTALDALSGTGAFTETGKVPAAALAVLYPSFVHVVVPEGSAITRVADFKGRPIGVGAPGSSTEAVADRLMVAAGLDPQADVVRRPLGLAASVAALQSKQIDAFVWVGGLPTTAISDLASAQRVQLLDVSALLGPLQKVYGASYAPMTLPAGTYAGQPGDLPGVGVATLLTARADMPDAQVTAILSAIFDNIDEVRQAHPAARTLRLETAWVGSPIPFHRAAEAFYRQRGVWR